MALSGWKFDCPRISLSIVGSRLKTKSGMIINDLPPRRGKSFIGCALNASFDFGVPVGGDFPPLEKRHIHKTHQGTSIFAVPVGNGIIRIRNCFSRWLRNQSSFLLLSDLANKSYGSWWFFSRLSHPGAMMLAGIVINFLPYHTNVFLLLAWPAFAIPLAIATHRHRHGQNQVFHRGETLEVHSRLQLKKC